MMTAANTPEWNLILRLALELCALVAFGIWGWQRHEWAGVIIGPVVAAALWGVFNVAGDPSRADHVVVAVAGWMRLLIETAIFGGAVYALTSSGYRAFGVLLGVTVVFHYLMYLDRLRWLLKQ
jgi:hypothetical protein